MQFKQLPSLKLRSQCNIIHTQTISFEQHSFNGKGALNETYEL